MAVTFIERPSDFPGTADSIKWQNFSNTVIRPASGTNIGTSEGGLGFSVNNPGRSKIMRQGDPWDGNFPADQALIFTWKLVGPVWLKFDSPIRGIGACIQEQFGTGFETGANFTAVIRVFGSGHNPLAPSSFGTAPGRSNDGTGGQKAIFVGALSDQQNIHSVEFDTIAGNDILGGRSDTTRDFAVGRITICP